MSERVVVPPEMMKAAQLEAFGCDVPVMEFMQRGIEAALFWLSEHPIVPTDEQLREMFPNVSHGVITHVMRWWASRMFRAPEAADPEDRRYQQEMERLCGDGSFEMKAGFQRGWLAALKTAPPPEPEVPEAVKDLLYMPPEFGLDVTSNRECLNEQILEAHRRGLRDKPDVP